MMSVRIPLTEALLGERPLMKRVKGTKGRPKHTIVQQPSMRDRLKDKGLTATEPSEYCAHVA